MVFGFYRYRCHSTVYSDRPTLQQCDVINGSIQITDDLNIYQRIMRSTSLLKSIRALVNVPRRADYNSRPVHIKELKNVTVDGVDMYDIICRFLHVGYA